MPGRVPSSAAASLQASALAGGGGGGGGPRCGSSLRLSNSLFLASFTFTLPLCSPLSAFICKTSQLHSLAPRAEMRLPRWHSLSQPALLIYILPSLLLLLPPSLAYRDAESAVIHLTDGAPPCSSFLTSARLSPPHPTTTTSPSPQQTSIITPAQVSLALPQPARSSDLTPLHRILSGTWLILFHSRHQCAACKVSATAGCDWWWWWW